jgi:hypothetical protein
MLINNASELNVSGEVGIRRFGFADNAKAFRVLSDTLYSNKIASIVRELSSNASDAHKASGKEDVPFVVNCPTFLESSFFIRDFGNGISEEDIFNVYVSYFTSTKDKCNDYIGGFGLGSKTPFSYVDQFSVTSFQKGIKKDYIAFFDSEGFPSLAKVAESKTSEQDGLKIEFPVNSNDFGKFKEAITTNYRAYDVLPCINGLVIEEIQSISNEEKEALRNKGYCYAKGHLRGLFAKIGNVLYSIDDSVNQNFIYTVMGCLIIDCGIGNVEVTPSRESISYSQESISFLSEKIKSVANDVLEGNYIKNRYCNNDVISYNVSLLAKMFEFVHYANSSLNKEYIDFFNTNKVFRIKELSKLIISKYLITSRKKYFAKLDDNIGYLSHASTIVIVYADDALVYSKKRVADEIASKANSSNSMFIFISATSMPFFQSVFGDDFLYVDAKDHKNSGAKKPRASVNKEQVVSHYIVKSEHCRVAATCSIDKSQLSNLIFAPKDIIEDKFLDRLLPVGSMLVKNSKYKNKARNVFDCLNINELALCYASNELFSKGSIYLSYLYFEDDTIEINGNNVSVKSLYDRRWHYSDDIGSNFDLKSMIDYNKLINIRESALKIECFLRDDELFYRSNVDSVRKNIDIFHSYLKKANLSFIGV